MVFADSVNLARRLSSKIENDLLQENMMDSRHSYESCMAISQKLSNSGELPRECRQYKDVVSNLTASSKKDDTAAIAFQGMGGSAAAAAVSHAQIQRRYTNTRRFTKERK